MSLNRPEERRDLFPGERIDLEDFPLPPQKIAGLPAELEKRVDFHEFVLDGAREDRAQAEFDVLDRFPFETLADLRDDELLHVHAPYFAEPFSLEGRDEVSPDDALVILTRRVLARRLRVALDPLGCVRFEQGFLPFLLDIHGTENEARPYLGSHHLRRLPVAYLL